MVSQWWVKINDDRPKDTFWIAGDLDLPDIDLKTMTHSMNHNNLNRKIIGTIRTIVLYPEEEEEETSLTELKSSVIPHSHWITDQCQGVTRIEN